MSIRKPSYTFFLWTYILCTTPHLNANEDAKELAREYVLLAQEKTHAEKTDDAIRFYKKALEIDPECGNAYFYLGNTFFHQGDIEKAVDYYKQAAIFSPQHAEIHCNLGICANQLNKPQKAVQYFKDAIAANPRCTTAHKQLAVMLEKQKNYKQALVHFDMVIEHNPKDAETASHTARMLKHLEQFEEAAHYYRIAYELQPNDLQTILALANVLNIIDENEQALELYYKALEMRPDLNGVLYNFGFTLKKMGHIKRAIDVYKQVIERNPDYPHAHFSLALSHLALGDFTRGWLEYEWRWAAYNEKPKEFPQPMWDGSDLKNKKIYVYAEQGFGDTFQFIRYLALLKEKGAHVIFHTQSPLKRFITLCPYIDQVTNYKDPLPDFDYHIPLMSLPLLFNTTLDTVPAEIPYLYADKQLTKKWKQQFKKNDHFKIGICWQGNAQYQTASLRRAVAAKSFHLKHFQVLADIPDVQLYSLQKINGTDQISELDNASFLHIFEGDFDNSHGRFMDTAAVIKNLDLVITIDTSIGHFAAALGTPTWILLPHPPDWRWMYDRDDTPWYPNVRLFRQETRGDWNALMHTVAKELYKKLKKHNPALPPYNTPLENNLSTMVRSLTSHIDTLQTHATHDVHTTKQLAVAYALKHDMLRHLTP